MNWIGTGKALTFSDYVEVADDLDVEVEALRAIVQVEAASYGFDDKDRLRILFEPHIFWRQLGPGAKRDRAAREGLAYPGWGDKPYPRTQDLRYSQVDRACAIDETAALNSVSWGLPQMMGWHAAEIGYGTPQNMIREFLKGEAEQLEGLKRFLVANNLVRHLKNHAWASFARAYNGAGYAKNAYDTKMADAYAKFVRNPMAGFTQMPNAPIAQLNDTPLLYPGMRSEPFRQFIIEAQTLLTQKGYNVGPHGVDGVYSTDTIAAVRRFQEDHPETGLIDGKVGDNTWGILRAADSSSAPATIPPPAGSRDPEEPSVVVPVPPVTTPSVQVPTQPVQPPATPPAAEANFTGFIVITIVVIAAIFLRKQIGKLAGWLGAKFTALRKKVW